MADDPTPSDAKSASTASAARSGFGSATSATGSGNAGASGDESAPAEATGRSLRVEVRDEGRTVVNLRLPLALGRYAIDRIPGLSGDQVDRVRDALSSGMTGPVLVVDDEHGGVRISID